MIKMNANRQMENKNAAVEAFRAIVQYELGHPEIEQNHCYTLPHFLGVDFAGQLDESTDNAIWDSLRIVSQMDAEAGSDVQLPDRTCFNCLATEEKLGDFKFCAQCNKACYCSRLCQKEHWKKHKKDCGKKRKN
jgi:hypothetical protein